MRIRFRYLPIIFLFLITLTLSAQEKYLQSGPMVGYSEMMEVLLWVQTNAPASVQFSYYEEGQPAQKYRTAEVRTELHSAYTAKLVADQVEPGRKYTYELYINGKLVKRPYPLKFQTQHLWQWREDPPPFRFVIGSCFYVNETEYDRPGKPYGDHYEIMTAIYQQQPDFMLWMGDNTYLREVDWYSRSGILHRNTHTRSLPELQPLLGSVHHYATWDDHDYGPNNSDRSFRQKADTREAFELFWGNPTYGIDGGPGITTMFQWADVDFFLLDNRTFRTPNRRSTGERTILGKQQLQWLIDALNASEAPFKMVVMGGQFLNPYNGYENYSGFPEEREQILRAISENDIYGVIFFDGDRHHSELSKLDRPGRYPIYDLTVSPFTAGPNPNAATEANYLRVENTFYGDRNFALLEVSGPRKDRVLKISLRDKTGAERWQQEIRAQALR